MPIFKVGHKISKNLKADNIYKINTKIWTFSAFQNFRCATVLLFLKYFEIIVEKLFSEKS